MPYTYECTQSYIDDCLQDAISRIYVYPEWTKDIREDWLALPPKIVWYPYDARSVNQANMVGGITVKSEASGFKCMHSQEEQREIYDKWFKDTLIDIVIVTVFSRVGLINTAAMRDIPMKKAAEQIVRHEFRHILQTLYLKYKGEIYTVGKSAEIRKLFSYGGQEQIFEEDAREVQYCRHDKPIEEFYQEYKRYQYIRLRRHIKHKSPNEIYLVD